MRFARSIFVISALVVGASALAQQPPDDPAWQDPANWKIQKAWAGVWSYVVQKPDGTQLPPSSGNITTAAACIQSRDAGNVYHAGWVYTLSEGATCYITASYIGPGTLPAGTATVLLDPVSHGQADNDTGVVNYSTADGPGLNYMRYSHDSWVEPVNRFHDWTEWSSSMPYQTFAVMNPGVGQGCGASLTFSASAVATLRANGTVNVSMALGSRFGGFVRS